MMSAEFPKINPEPFSYPCASYDGNVEDFVNENCPSPYSTLTYSDPPCPQLFSDTNHHSLLLQELAMERDHRLLCNSQERESTGRSSYSCEHNIHIKILMDEPVIQLDTSAPSTIHCDPPDNMCTVPLGEDRLMGGVTVQVECADESNAAVIDKTTNIEKLAQNLLATECIEFAAPSLNDDFEQSGSPTPTPSYADRLTTPTVEYPGEEGTAACGIRGGEVAKIEEFLTNVNTTRIHDGVQRKQNRANQVVGDAEELSLSRRMTPYRDTSPINLFAPLTTPRRRSGSTLLQHLPVAHHMLHIPPLEMRKLSDSTVCTRREKIQKTASNLQKQRCLSDSSTPNCSFQQYEDEERESSAHGCDSGFQDDKGSRFPPESMSAHFSSPRMSLQSLDLLSQDGSEVNSRVRRNTPLPLCNQDGSQSDDTSGIYQSSNSGNPGTMVYPRERSRRSLMKHYSQGSISGLSVGTSSIGASSDSPSLSSLLDCQSNITGVTDLLSSLGFDDFDNPQLVPDRFIPKDLDYLKPSCMKLSLTEQIVSTDLPRSPDSLGSELSPNLPKLTKGSTSIEPSELPLGATAENFLDYKPRPSSPVAAVSLSNDLVEEEPLPPTNQSDGTPLFTDTTAIMEFTRSRILETVPEETASDLSPSPRWFSPRVSIDHSVHLDYADGKLGTTLNVQKVRKRSLPNNREGYRWSIGSLVESDTGDSIHLSVTSYDDMIAAEREKERENYPSVGCEDNIVGLARRRRIGVYNPPQTLLSWLSTQKTIDEEVADPEELPWPFNEQAHLRKSLTEMSLAQKLALSEYPLEAGTDDSCDRITPVSCPGSPCDDSISLSPIGSPNARCSPQPDVSDDEDSQTEEESDYHMEKASSPSLLPSDMSRMMRSLGQDSSTNSSTASLLQTERGSLSTLSLDPCLEVGATHLPPHIASGDISPETSFLSNSRLQELPIGDSIADRDIKNLPPQLPKTTLLPRHSCCAVGASEDPTTITAPEEQDATGSPSESDVLCRKCSLAVSPASEAKDPPFLQMSRRQRYVEHKSKSLDRRLLQPSASPVPTTGRVRRKAMYGDAPTLQSPVTDLFVLSPSRGKFNKEFEEVEKYMIL